MRNNQSHAMSVFDSLNLDKITVIQKPALLKLNTKNGPIQIIGLPYVRPNQLLTIDEYRNLEPAQLDNKIRNNVELVFKNYYNQLEKDTAAIVTAHMTLDQAVAGIEEELMVGHNITFPSSIFEDHRVNYVALGHVHKHQVIRKNNPGIVYSGSPERIDFSEEKEDKGFMHVCINGNDTTFKFISTNARTFITISIDLSNHEHKTENDANESLTLAIKKELAKVKIADCVLRLRCKIKQEDFAKLNVKEIEKLFTDCFYFQFEPQIFTLERKSRIPELESMDGQTPLSALKTYLQEVKPERLEPLLGKAAELMQNINEKDSKK
jgi:exonuclease SbcD